MEAEIKNTEKLEKNKKIFRKYLVFFIFIFLLISSFGFGYITGKNSETRLLQKSIPLKSTSVENRFPENEQALDFSLFWKVWDLLKEKHVNNKILDAQQLFYGSIKGMLRATGDPYTTFFDPKETKSFSQEIESSFEGIGAELGIKDGALTVIAPLEDSPAEKAGLLAGDKILKINDKITSDISIEEAVELIRGKSGTEVKLTILHKGQEETKEITILRDKIEVKSVELEFKDGNIAYLNVNKFNEDTSNEFNSAANLIISKNAKGIILDLRNNPGGFLDQSVNIASRMISKGKVVVMEEDNNGKKENLYTAGGDKLSSIPTVVLINEGSASASEILAGALRDNRGIKIVGEKSFGKGSVQELINLPGNSSVKITVAKWMTPNGDYIMDKGISPDVKIDITKDDLENKRDPQLDKALEILRESL